MAAPAPKTTVVKAVTKITMEKKVAPPSISTKKPSMSVNDLINKSSKATKFAAVPVQKPKETEEKLDKSGKKRKRKTVAWVPEDKLEQVRVFEKDAKQPKEVAFPDPSRDGTTDASVGKLWSEETEKSRRREKLRQAASASSRRDACHHQLANASSHRARQRSQRSRGARSRCGIGRVSTNFTNRG